jgi:hypothetical protein
MQRVSTIAPSLNPLKEPTMNAAAIDTRFQHAATDEGIAQPGRIGEAALLIGTSLLSFAPIAILGPAIGWPASLRAPAADQLAAILNAPGAVAAGYSVYLLYSILVLPVMVLVARRVFGGLAHPLAQMVVAFAAISVLARSIGIARWLTVMPQLASAHAGADAAGQQTIQTVFRALTIYGGGIGELLGVALFMAIAVGIAMVAALARKTLPLWLSGLGLVSAALLFGMFLPAAGVALQVPVAAAATMVSVWMLAFGIWIASRKRST